MGMLLSGVPPLRAAFDAAGAVVTQVRRAHERSVPDAGLRGDAGQHAEWMDAAVAAGPVALRRMAEALESSPASRPDGLAASDLSRELEGARRRQRHVAAMMREAEQNAAAAARRHQELLEPTRTRRWLTRLRTIALTIGGTGTLIGTLCFTLLVVAYLCPGPLLVMPVVAALIAVVMVTIRAAQGGTTDARRPAVSDLVGAVSQMHAAEATLAMRQAEVAALRAREQELAAAAWSADRARRARAAASSWCARHRVPADAEVLRELAGAAQQRNRLTSMGQVLVVR